MSELLLLLSQVNTHMITQHPMFIYYEPMLLHKYAMFIYYEPNCTNMQYSYSHLL